MKIPRLSGLPALSLFVLSLVTPPGALAADPSKKADDDFAEHFFDKENISDYTAKIDELIAKAEGRVFSSPSEYKDNMPGVRSNNGIRMLCSVTATAEGTLYHLSVSRPPCLATPFGVNIVGLFIDRSGLPVQPSMFNVSKNQVFHAVWLFRKDTIGQENADMAKRRAGNRSEQNAPKAFLRAIKNGTGLRQLLAAQKKTAP